MEFPITIMRKSLRNDASTIALLKYRKNEHRHTLIKARCKEPPGKSCIELSELSFRPPMSNTYTIVHVLYRHWQYDWHIVDFCSCFVVSIHGNSKVEIYLFSHSLHSHHLFTSSFSWKTKPITENENNLKL